MTEQQYFDNLIPPETADVVLDTDAYNEIDDLYAIAYLLGSGDKLTTKAIYAAPFLNRLSESAVDGMEKSYVQIHKMLSLLDAEMPVFRGSEQFLKDETTPVISPAAQDLINRAANYSPARPLYVVAIGAITNVASALLMQPEIAKNIVVVWLGGHAHHYKDTHEFNMYQDIAAARVVMNSGVPFVQLPCKGVVDRFSISSAEVNCWLKGHSELTDYLAHATIEHMKRKTESEIWSKVIWDVTAVAWLIGGNGQFMSADILPIRLPNYESLYEETTLPRSMAYVREIHRDALMQDMIKKLKEKTQ